jgi:hypothetical protein
LRQLMYLRGELVWRRSDTDAFITALLLGSLHGESHKTGWCLSNRMPRTISTKPGYSVRWWRNNGFVAPKRDAFEILRQLALYRYASEVPNRRGVVVQSDARALAKRLPSYAGRVKLMVTSPPYLDTTNYREDQWLRLWFLENKVPLAKPAKPTDDRHRRAAGYWTFLTEAWGGGGSLVGPAGSPRSTDRRASVVTPRGAREPCFVPEKGPSPARFPCGRVVQHHRWGTAALFPTWCSRNEGRARLPSRARQVDAVPTRPRGRCTLFQTGWRISERFRTALRRTRTERLRTERLPRSRGQIVPSLSHARVLR